MYIIDDAVLVDLTAADDVNMFILYIFDVQIFALLKLCVIISCQTY